jgi:hypothetical protein
VILVATALFTHRNLCPSVWDVVGIGEHEHGRDYSESFPLDGAYSYICKALLILAGVALFSIRFFAPLLLLLGVLGNRTVRRLPIAPAFAA